MGGPRALSCRLKENRNTDLPLSETGSPLSLLPLSWDFDFFLPSDSDWNVGPAWAWSRLAVPLELRRGSQASRLGLGLAAGSPKSPDP